MSCRQKGVKRRKRSFLTWEREDWKDEALACSAYTTKPPEDCVHREATTTQTRGLPKLFSDSSRAFALTLTVGLYCSRPEAKGDGESVSETLAKAIIPARVAWLFRLIHAAFACSDV